MIKTKFICTIGPASASRDALLELMQRGMAVARLNLAHCDWAFARGVIQAVRDIVETEDVGECALWIDINGPKVRYVYSSVDVELCCFFNFIGCQFGNLDIYNFSLAFNVIKMI